MSENLRRSMGFSLSEAEYKANIATVDLDLSSGLVNHVVNVPGTLVYLDRSSTGYCTVELNSRNSPSINPVTVIAGDSIECPFSALKINAPAQAGKSIKLLLCMGVSIRGGAGISTGETTIAATVNNYPQGVIVNDGYASATALAAGTPALIFSPGSNANGAIIQVADYSVTVAAGMGLFGFVSNTTTPTNLLDGWVIAAGMVNAAVGIMPATLKNGPVQIPAGRGLWRICNAAEVSVLASCVYKLL